MIKIGKELTPEEIIRDETNYLQSQLDRYKKGFDILMDYWDCLPEEEREEIDRRLNDLRI